MLADKHWGIHAPLRGCILPCSAEAAILAIEAEARATHEHVYGRFGEDDPLSWTCGVCGLPKPAAPDPAPLDVERLARAFWSVTRERFAASPLVPDLPEWRDPSIDAATWDKSVSDAAEVAREYAKEPQP